MNNLRGSRHAARRTRRPSRAVAGAALLASLTVGCSSSYVPASSPRVSLVMKGGTYSYARDGKEFEGGLFGGEIEEAVRGNPEAEEYARSYKDGMLTGFALSLVGVAAAVGGATVVGASLGQNESNVSSLGAAGLAITTGGLITEIVGLMVEANASHPRVRRRQRLQRRAASKRWYVDSAELRRPAGEDRQKVREDQEGGGTAARSVLDRSSYLSDSLISMFPLFLSKPAPCGQGKIWRM